MSARNETSAENKLSRRWGAAVTNVRIDGAAEEAATLPDCACGWSGSGTGPGGQFVRGDRCPNCGEPLS